MERQKNFGRIDRAAREPGRRYNAARVIPRGERAEAPKPAAPAPKKHLDIKPKENSAKRGASSAKPALPRTAKSLVLRRQIVEHAKQQKHKARKKYGKHVFIYGAIAATVFAAALIIWAFQDLLPVNLHMFNKEPAEKVVNRPIIQETSSLDETAVTAEDLAAHKMGQDEPRLLKIPSLTVDARIKRVGVSLNGEPIATGNIFDVGWFEASGKPGSPGAVLLNGHVSGPSKDGVFAQLGSLKAGDKVILERGDGKELTYIVQKVQEYSTNAVDMDAATQPLDPTKQGLNLMTTANKFTGRSEQTDKRLVVFALLQ